VLALALVGAACDRAADPPERTRPSPSPGRDGSAGLAIEIPAGPDGPESSTAAMRRLCERPTAEEPPATRAEDPVPLPEGIRGILEAVERVRGRSFLEEPRAEPLTRKQMRAKILASYDRSFPEAFYARRSVAWQVLGVIPDGLSIADALREFGASQVAGFYVPSTKELSFIGTDDPGFIGGVTLAHELTHALDDQHFDLRRLDRLEAACRDERLQAALGAVEGSAQLFASQVALMVFSTEEALKAIAELPAALTGTPDLTPFLTELALWPYLAGQRFMSERAASGGVPAVDAALRRLPVSTEQVIHPEKYPIEVPRELDVLDARDSLGDGWETIDVMDVGEAWLQALLENELDPGGIAGAAEGWDGGRYRAWSDGRDVAIVLVTAWDSVRDAGEFESAIGRYVREIGRPSSVRRRGDVVTVGLATRAALLERLGEAADRPAA
jgi:hypothetical protein